MRQLVQLVVRLALFIAYKSYKAEGLHALFLFLPAKFLSPTLRKYGAQIGKDVEMHTPVIFHNVSPLPGSHYSNLKIGSECYFGRDVFFDLADKIIVEDKVTVSMRVTLITHTDTGHSPLTIARLPPSHAPILLGKGCYLGAGAIILAGVRIGQNSIIGAGAVVTHDVPDNSVVGGVPAKEIFRSDN